MTAEPHAPMAAPNRPHRTLNCCGSPVRGSTGSIPAASFGGTGKNTIGASSVAEQISSPAAHTAIGTRNSACAAVGSASGLFAPERVAADVLQPRRPDYAHRLGELALVCDHDRVALEVGPGCRGQHCVAGASGGADCIEDGPQVAARVELGEHPIVVVEPFTLVGGEQADRSVVGVRDNLLEVVVHLGPVCEPSEPEVTSLHFHGAPPAFGPLPPNK